MIGRDTIRRGVKFLKGLTKKEKHIHIHGTTAPSKVLKSLKKKVADSDIYNSRFCAEILTLCITACQLEKPINQNVRNFLIKNKAYECLILCRDDIFINDDEDANILYDSLSISLESVFNSFGLTLVVNNDDSSMISE